jgi:hypothetical protein
LNVYGAKDVRQSEIHTTRPQVSKPSAFEVGMGTERLKRYKSQGMNQTPEALIQA